MSTTLLTPNPNIQHLKKQAKDLRRAHRSGDASVCTMLKKYLSKFADLPNEEILADKLSLHDAQHVVAQRYGFDHWSDLREEVARRAEQGTPVSVLEKFD